MAKNEPHVVVLGATGGLARALSEASLGMYAFGRVRDPRKVASMVSWLLDPTSHWETGQVFGVDGWLATGKPRPEV